jgi:hypothetical protein
LNPISSQLTPTERVARFEALRPVKQGTLSTNGTQVDNWLVLADKTEIGYPEDLAPVLDENSETVRVGRQSAALRTRKNVTGTIATVLVLGGLALAGISGQIDGHIVGQPWLSLSMIGTGVVTGVFYRHYRAEELDLRRKAFATYPRDLGAKLNVCAHGLQVVACEAPLPAPPVPAAAPQP